MNGGVTPIHRGRFVAGAAEAAGASNAPLLPTNQANAQEGTTSTVVDSIFRAIQHSLHWLSTTTQ